MAEKAEALGASLRRRAGVGPFAPPSAVARALGREVTLLHLPGGMRGYSVVGHKKILVEPTGYRPMEEFTIAHELIEGELPEKLPEGHEDFCDRAAASLLLPRAEFLMALGKSLLDVPAVCRAFPWTSYQAAVWRAAELVERVAAATWDRGAVVERRCLRPATEDVTTAELAAVREAWARGRGDALVGGVAATAWWLQGRGQRYRAVSIAVLG